MKRTTTTPAAGATPVMRDPFQEVEEIFERFCLKDGLATLMEMLKADASALCGPRMVVRRKRREKERGQSRFPAHRDRRP